MKVRATVVFESDSVLMGVADIFSALEQQGTVITELEVGEWD